MFKIAENNSSIIITKSKKRHNMYKDQIQLASFIELRISFSLMLYSFTMTFLVVSFLHIYPAWFLLCPWVWPKILFNNSGKFSAILFSHITFAPSLFSFWSSVRPKLLQSCPTLCSLPWIVACQAPLSTGLSQQEYWNGLSCPPPGDLFKPGSKTVSLVSSTLAGGFFTSSAPWEAPVRCISPVHSFSLIYFPMYYMWFLCHLLDNVLMIICPWDH